MKKIRVGIFGAGRGMDLAKNLMMLDCDIVAICDSYEERREKALKIVGNTATVYEDFDSFIEHDMDAVVLANYFHEHVPYAIKCFEKGLHVFSECMSNGTMAEGVELIEAYEKSNSIYMLAENYPQMKFNLEMQRICKGGTLGKILYAEGEYNHPSDPYDIEFQKLCFHYYEKSLREKHWRCYLPTTYYITHSLGPVMRATGATPKKVTAFAAFAPAEGDVPVGKYVGDSAAIITTQNDDGSIFRVTGCARFGGHHNSYRICGTNGQIENLRGMGEQIMLRYNEWNKPEDKEEINLYEPSWNDKDEELIKDSGHGGSDYLTARMFVDCIREGKQPEHPFDIYSAVTMASVSILSHRSVLEGGKTYDIPDFKNKDCREIFRNDRLTPFFGSNGKEPNMPCCSHTDFKPEENQVKKFKELILEIKDEEN